MLHAFVDFLEVTKAKFIVVDMLDDLCKLGLGFTITLGFFLKGKHIIKDL